LAAGGAAHAEPAASNVKIAAQGRNRQHSFPSKLNRMQFLMKSDIGGLPAEGRELTACDMR
jgi:hypothetical protein